MSCVRLILDLFAGCGLEIACPGDLVPGETELMSIHNVSRATVRRAMDELEFEGLIRRHRGKGSFLLSPSDTTRHNKTKTFRWGCIVRHWSSVRFHPEPDRRA